MSPHPQHPAWQRRALFPGSLPRSASSRPLLSAPVSLAGHGLQEDLTGGGRKDSQGGVLAGSPP